MRVAARHRKGERMLEIARGAHERGTEPVETAQLDQVDYRDRLVWLGQLRWWAMLSAMAGVGLAVALEWSFVTAPAVAGGVAVVVLLNQSRQAVTTLGMALMQEALKGAE